MRVSSLSKKTLVRHFKGLDTQLDFRNINLMRLISSLVKGQAVLDIGSGSGLLLNMLRKLNVVKEILNIVLKRALKNIRSIILISILIKTFAAFVYSTGDSGAINVATSLLLKGEEVYNNPDLYFSPPPLTLHILTFLRFIADTFNIPFEGVWKIPSLLADAGIVYLIYIIAIKHFKQGINKAKTMAAWYAFNPISFFISGYHGQMEAVWLFFIILSWYFLIVRPKFSLSLLWAAIALSYKLPAILLLSGFFYIIKGYVKRMWFIVGVVFLFFLSLLPELISSTGGLIDQVFLYTSTPNVWGFSFLFSNVFPLEEVSNINLSEIRNVYLVAMILVLMLHFLKTFLSKAFNFFNFSLGVIFIFLIFTPGFGTQYLLWPLPFLILTNHSYLKLYTVFVTFAFLNTYGLMFGPLDYVLTLLNQNIWQKLAWGYPFNLYLPIWILIIVSTFKKTNFAKKNSE